MDSLFFHPRLVHIPMALGALMPLVAGALLLSWWRKWLPARAWAIAVLMQAMLVGSGMAALSSGEQEEDRVEEVVAEHFIEQHEEAAEAFVGVSAAVLGVMLLSLLGTGTKLGLRGASLAVAGTLIVFALGIRTGHAGGALVYEHGAAAAYVDNAARGDGAGVRAPGGHDDHDHKDHRDAHDQDD